MGVFGSESPHASATVPPACGASIMPTGVPSSTAQKMIELDAADPPASAVTSSARSGDTRHAVTGVPCEPGPHMNERMPHAGPQSVDRMKENVCCATVGGAALPLSVFVAALVPSGAAMTLAAPPADAVTTCVPTTPVYDTGVADTSFTTAGPRGAPLMTVAVMVSFGSLGHVTLMVGLENPPCPMLTPVTDRPSQLTMERSRRGMVTLKGITSNWGADDDAAPLPTRTETMRESSEREGRRSRATVGRGLATRSAAPDAL